ncbi:MULTISPECIES: hypothetical protein [unclassified Pseudactinotalea]|uniref:DUF6290 family protein n=1 Tax=unclassified Pseudactinotalea TaxID=2649176 RepID=UPI00128D2B46|nr:MULTISPECIES: hypothetical protein [unclassified Pseudactinotalea]MPV50652.1 hypothetical protein [Pseudactinotalea sp. HY160]QGH69766.1 hypothetical protein GCE65_09770 [Pseudactinotalea sp. HY158]
MNDHDDLADVLRLEAEAAEANPDAPLRPGTLITRRNQRSRVYSLRLNESEIEALEAAAERAGIPASTLARTWIVERLAEGDDTTDLRAIADALATFSRRLAAF